MDGNLGLPVTVLYGVSEARRKLFAHLGINTLKDLIYYYPVHHEDRSHIVKTDEIVSGECASLILEVQSAVTSARIKSGRTGRAMTVQKFIASDDTGGVRMTFFNSEFLKTVFTVGRKFRFYGVITGLAGSCSMTSPEYEPFDENLPLKPLVPKYSLTAGLSSKLISSCVLRALEKCADSITDYLDESERERYGLISEKEALFGIHFPKSENQLDEAKKRLAFDELYELQLKTMLLGKREKSGQARRICYPDMKLFVNSLPFELTHAQKKAIQDILIDITGVKNPKEEICTKQEFICPARRLVQGDVGSGKTAVACAAIYACAKSGFQSALMVPTGILARQHYDSLSDTLGKFGISCELLTGNTPAAEKKRILKSVSDGTADVLIGTHALIEDKVKFDKLALVVTDEQHRFGVEQRKALEAKSSSEKDKDGIKPHTVVMSATPIPRTLAMIIYCDLDISVIDELPKGRIKVDTASVGTLKRAKAYSFLYDRVKEGRQAYVVCALAEEKNKDGEYIQTNGYEMRSAKSLCKELSEGYLKGLRVSYIHGRMKQTEKDAVMYEFAAGNIDVLVSTTVIEVGVNVPNAAVMLVENAERFGLSQLHQLRGRVGRGQHKSYCILVSPLAGKKKDSDFSKRMEIMCRTNDGFEISEKDLELRGPGEFFGRRQHGELCLKMADAVHDIELVENAKQLAQRKIAETAGLEIGQIGI